jgi:hypothetical protein
MRSFIRSMVVLCSLWAVPAGATEIGFIEDFALAKDRADALKLLIPGSEDFYYYSSLHHQNIQQFDKVNELLQQWVNRYGHTQRVVEIQLRQALLTYERNPEQSLEFIRRHLHLEFNHQRENVGEVPNLPSELDPRLISREQLVQSTISRFANLDGFEDAALDWLVGHSLDADRRRVLLQRLQRPDYPNLPKLVVDDLNHQNSSGFGAFAVHKQLLLAQLDECLRLKPDLLNEQNFVHTYLSKLQPHADADWQNDSREKEAYLNRLWAFVQRLAPAHNSLKAHVLYQRLAFDRTQGVYDQQRFLAYISLPRNVVYIARAYLQREDNRGFAADLNADFQSVTLFPPIVNDEPLVRDYLMHFFQEENTTKPYETLIDDIYLRHIFAETKIVHGLGNPEQWYSLLPPELYQRLKDRVDLEFAPTNKTRFGADEPVVLDLDVKNVRTLIVKVFEINARNYYQQYQREVNTDINLDGLVANDERTLEYVEPPLRRVRRHFEFESLSRPGVYVIDFIGNGMSSRVVVRKGQLRILPRITTAGHQFTILDDSNQMVKDASLWLAGHEYQPGKDGRVTVPFTDKPAQQTVLVTRGASSSLEQFQHLAENYSLVAGIHIDREALIARRNAEVLVRPALYLNGYPVTLSVLEDVKLTISTTDHDGVTTTKEISPFQLFEDREATYEFQTPSRLANITFSLTAKVQNLSQNKKIDLAVAQTLSLNSIDKTDKVEDLHLAKIDKEYVVELLGKSGEAKSDRAVQFSVKHRHFREPVQVSLKTDPRGRIRLGKLVDIDSVTATGPEGTAHTWPIRDDRHAYHSSLHGVAGQAIQIPLMRDTATATNPTSKPSESPKPSRTELSLLELRGESFVADRFENLAIENGMLVARNLQAGDYDLWLKRENRRIRIRLAAGPARDGMVLGANRHLELRGSEALQIVSVQTDKDALQIQLHHATKFSRVHVFATRFQPENDSFANFARVVDPDPYRVILGKTDARYVSGRNIGDEYRYIIDRKFAHKYPGVMLERPSLLLNPWSVRTTQTGQQQAQAGGDFAASPPAPRSEALMEQLAASEAAGAIAPPLTSNLDFLTEPTTILSNLEPDEKGLVSVPLSQLGSHQYVHVVAVDPVSTVYRSVSLAEKSTKFRDLRLASGLDPKQHFTQQKRISIVKQSEVFDLADIVTSKFETYDSLQRVYALYATLSHDAHLQEFSFVTNWPQLKREEKQAKYSKYACHELSFFLFKKDPEFFVSVVKPYLVNKKDRTFLDNWLLEESLTDYLKPWRYEQLNVVERILLAQRIEADQQHGRRHIQDSFDLLPTDMDRFNLLFRTAIRGSALETGDQLGLIDAVKQQRLEKELMIRDPMSRDAKSSGGAAGALGAMGRFDANGTIPAPAAAPRIQIQEESEAKLGGLQKNVLGDSPADRAATEAAPESRMARRRAGRGVEAGKDKAEYFFSDDDTRKSARQFFQQLDKTQEWAENNYYKLPIDQQNANLVTVNTFWRDYAKHDAKTPFHSTNFADASRNFTEMMFALSLLDLPFSASKHDSKFEQTAMKLTAANPMIVFHEEIRPASSRVEQTPILVSQNFFNAHDRYRHENNEQLDKFVSDEFLVHTVYGCQVVVTNPTSSPQKLDVLTQIPVGSIAVSGGEATRSSHIQLQPFSTHTIEYSFYFPATGKYPHYPVHVSKNEQLLAHAEPMTFVAVDKLSRIDRDSWEYVSQHGTAEQVIEFLKTANLQRTNLDKIAFRMSDAEFFLRVVDLLTTRHAYNHVLWSYGIKHNSVPAIREYLQHANEFVAQVGEFVDSPLVTVNPVLRKTYQHLDYLPLVNARAHQLGRRRQVLNDALSQQYHRLLKVVGYRRAASDQDRLDVTYYLLLQDRIEEADQFFRQVNAEKLSTRLQYDYFATYLELYREDLSAAEQIANRYEQHPVDRWRNAFAAVKTQIGEAKGSSTEVLDPENRAQVQTQLASTEPSLEFQVEGKKVLVNYQNFERVTVNYYLMDIELLFSRNPFVQTHGSQFSHIRPNLSQPLDLPKGQTAFAFDVPEQLRNRNVLIEISGGSQTKSHPYYANSLAVSLTENYGQLRVVTANPGKPLAKVYVKVYARMKDGGVRFYKDGYTDMRGRFDYASLSTNELEHVDRFSLLILSDDYGAVVREATPPQQ